MNNITKSLIGIVFITIIAAVLIKNKQNNSFGKSVIYVSSEDFDDMLQATKQPGKVSEKLKEAAIKAHNL
jgi:hypothetical protein